MGANSNWCTTLLKFIVLWLRSVFVKVLALIGAKLKDYPVQSPALKGANLNGTGAYHS